MSAPPLTRRQAALALLASAAALTSCDKPEEEIVPYVEQPDRVVPGVPMRFATTLTLNGYGRGVIATCFEGRPVKLEGNAAHPASLGGTDVFLEAAILSLYDPDRSRAVRQGLRIGALDNLVSALEPRLRGLEARGGEGLRILTGNVTSPTLLRLIGAVKARFPAMRWHAHEALGEENARAGAALAFGRPLSAMPRLDRAAVVVALDADPLGPGPDQPRHARGFAARRQARKAGGEGFSRLYAAEPVLSLTGAKADHRLPARPEEIAAVAAALAARLGLDVPAPELPGPARGFVEMAAADLAAHPGEALVLAGPWLPPDVQALVHAVNARLRAPVDYREPPVETPEPLSALVEDLRFRRADTLVVIGANPAHDSPAALGFAEALGRSQAFTLHLGPYFDETAALCRWHVPETHPLEGWGDARATDGTASVIQPLIRPIYDTRSAIWLLNLLLGDRDTGDRDAVRATWSAGRPAGEFEAWWRRVLHDGVVEASAAPVVTPPEPRLAPPAASTPGFTLLFRPDPSVWDGRYANNAWLQECPKPIIRQVWGNAVQIAPEEARALGLSAGDVSRLRLDGRVVEATVLLQGGMARGVAALTLGYGRRRAGAIGDGLGTDAYALRPADGSWSAAGLVLEATGRTAEILRPSDAHRIEAEEADLFPSLELAEFQRKAAGPPHEEEKLPTFYEPKNGDTYAWAMVIDSTLCIGCNACVIACQSENNVPIVGPEEIARGRDMHWLRIDTYELGPEENPRPGFQPVPCMHCETAPCEPVCPVAASVHDSEGLNVQVYNRCVGTRFCQANCPYKVRHFNYRGYADGQEYANLGAPGIAAQRNPEVTVRARGVMEKCTYCTQRISAARRAAEKEGRAIREGEVTTACQSACPSRAISFGDKRNPASAVAALRDEPQHHELLGHLNTRPRTTYLADVRNPRPEGGT
ncbi:4Fe-4S dicluster domain-containing protein [Pararoseomonas indoligenes]|uniref:4Fe-4S dicluster domain-containing protein n=1 Tax=Roseomonas indoligenes TaxID=2820811 RepID=A0A940MZ90_9PROT|nr:4Fe-4S dicluster domain-containing protein [Pararoseomonas indoligenes]MBP0491407.1 4Fe-4S dicluster domain-containing protein [Pararoseomonas indoligenes]